MCVSCKADCYWYVCVVQYAVPGFRCVPLLQALNGYQLEQEEEGEERDEVEQEVEGRELEEEGDDRKGKQEEKIVESLSCQEGDSLHL